MNPDPLRYHVVVLRGTVYGLVLSAAVVPSGLAVSDHLSRLTFYAVVSGFALLTAAIGLVVGSFYWLVNRGNNRRLRDDLTTRHGIYGTTSAAPVLIRLAGVGGVLALACYLAYRVVDAAASGSGWYGH